MTFNKLGFPGCIGSIDCTHINWENCPQVWQNMFTGKSGGPTVKFEVVVDHDRRVLHVSEAFTGVAHDQSVMENDPFPRDIAYGKLYVNTEPKVVFVKKEEGNYQQFWEGVYFLLRNS